MKCCVSTDVGTWTNWLTFEPDPDYSPDTGTGLLSPLSYKRWYAEFYVGKIRRIRIGRCSDAWFYGGFIHWASEPSKHLCRRYMRSTACRSSLMLNNVVAFRSQKVIVNKNFALRKEAGPPPVRLRRRQHNGRWLWTTDSERRSLFTTVDNTGGETTVCLVDSRCGLTSQMNRRPYWYLHVFCTLNQNNSQRIWMRQQNQRRQLPNSVP